MKALIDTNILLDAFLSREPWRENAEKIILACAEELVLGCITASSLTDIYYILNKAINNPAQTKQAMLKILTLFEVLSVSGADCEKALELPMTDYEDALQAYCAKKHKADWIITRDREHFENSPVKPISPGDFLGMLQVRI